MMGQKKLWRVVLFVCCVTMVCTAQLAIDRGREEAAQPGELMYFPSTRFTQAAVCGFDNLAGDYIWLDVVQYYGRHKLSDLQYRYLGHMLDVLTVLLPDFTTAYKFGSLLLISDAGDATGAFALLERGMRNNPTDWTIPFTRGFFNYVFVRDYREAGRWFALSARLPGASEMAGRFAAFAMDKGANPAMSRELWQDLYRRTANKTERDLAGYYIDKIDREVIADGLQRIAGQFTQDKRRPPSGLSELLNAGYLKYIPADPLGGRFVLESATGKVRAVGGRKL